MGKPEGGNLERKGAVYVVPFFSSTTFVGLGGIICLFNQVDVVHSRWMPWTVDREGKVGSVSYRGLGVFTVGR